MSRSSKPKAIEEEETWSCHCCTAKNSPDLQKCRVCGRPESYVQQGYRLPLHGKNSNLFRPTQVLTVLDDIHEVDSEHWSSLHSACASGNILIVKELLSYKAKLEPRTNMGHTPLHLAVYSGSLECVKELLKHHAEVNVVTNHEKCTPLHIACQRQYAQIAHLLLEHGADVHARNIILRTPLHFAAEVGRIDIGNMLLGSGADKDALDVHGWSARQIAELFGHREFQELIIRESMTEKQVIIKELPAAEWHSVLWFDVSRQHAQRSQEFKDAENKKAENAALVQSLLNIRKEKVIAQRRAERQREIQEYNDHKNEAKEMAHAYTEKMEVMKKKAKQLEEERAKNSKPSTPNNDKLLLLQFGGVSGSKPGSAAHLSRQNSINATAARRLPSGGSSSTALGLLSDGLPSPAHSKLNSRAGSLQPQVSFSGAPGEYPFPLPSRLTSAGLSAVLSSP